MKKIRTVLGLLIILGFLSTFVGGVRDVFGNPDGVTVEFEGASDADNYIELKTNLVVTGGRVVLGQVISCGAGGVYWDGACWYQGSSVEQSCNTICSSHGGCKPGNWNELADCSGPCRLLHPAPEFLWCLPESCNISACPAYAVLGPGAGACVTRNSSVNQDCSSLIPSSYTEYRRICACNN